MIPQARERMTMGRWDNGVNAWFLVPSSRWARRRCPRGLWEVRRGGGSLAGAGREGGPRWNLLSCSRRTGAGAPCRNWPQSSVLDADPGADGGFLEEASSEIAGQTNAA